MHPCEGCKECGTTFGHGPDGHEKLIPHDYSELHFNSKTGNPEYAVCSRCGGSGDVEEYVGPKKSRPNRWEANLSAAHHQGRMK